MAATAELRINCWIRWEVHRTDARYESLVQAIKDIPANIVITDFRNRNQLECAVQAIAAANRYDDKVLLLAHRTDLDGLSMRALNRVGALELQFTTTACAPLQRVDGSISDHVPYGSVRELCFCLSRATTYHFLSQQNLNELIEAHYSQAQRSVLDPLLPVAVLVEAFSAVRPLNAVQWFNPGIQAALEMDSPAGDSVASDTYWSDLRVSGPAMKRLREMLNDPLRATPGFPSVMMAAGERWPDASEQSDHGKQAILMYHRAYTAVKALWDTLTSEDGDPPEDTDMETLVEAASVGFQVLAAGHL